MLLKIMVMAILYQRIKAIFIKSSPTSPRSVKGDKIRNWGFHQLSLNNLNVIYVVESNYTLGSKIAFNSFFFLNKGKGKFIRLPSIANNLASNTCKNSEIYMYSLSCKWNLKLNQVKFGTCHIALMSCLILHLFSPAMYSMICPKMTLLHRLKDCGS